MRVFEVAHERHTKKGVTSLSDPRDKYENMANNAARRMRACILALIPGDVIEAAMAQADATLRADVKITPELVKNLTAKFIEFGVSKEAIEKSIQRRIETITPALVLRLRKIYNSLKDGMSLPADWFELEPTLEAEVSGSKSVAGKLAAIAQQIAPPAAEPVGAATEAAVVTEAISDAIESDPDFKKMKDAEVVDFLESTAQNLRMPSARLHGDRQRLWRQD